MSTILIIGGVLAVLLLIVGIVVSIGSERSLVEERLGQYAEDEFADQMAGGGEDSSALTDWVNVRVERSSWGEGIAKNLAQADVKLKPAEYVALTVILVIVFGGISFLNWWWYIWRIIRYHICSYWCGDWFYHSSGLRKPSKNETFAAV